MRGPYRGSGTVGPRIISSTRGKLALIRAAGDLAYAARMRSLGEDGPKRELWKQVARAAEAIAQETRLKLPEPD